MDTHAVDVFGLTHDVISSISPPPFPTISNHDNDHILSFEKKLSERERTLD